MLITAYNPPTEDLEKTTLSSPSAKLATVHKVRNNQGFAVNDRIMVGEIGREKTEILTVSAVNTNGLEITTGACKFAHNADDPIYKLRFDSVRFYRSTAGVNGTYNLLATEPLDVDNDEKTTSYDDTGGLESYHYKISYYHTVSTLESSRSGAILGSGYTRNQVGNIFDEVLLEVGDQNEAIATRDELFNWANEVSDILITRSRRPFDFLHRSATVDLTADTDFVSLNSIHANVWKIDFLEHVRTLGASSYTDQIRILPLEEFRVKQSIPTTNSDQLLYATIDEANDRLLLYPKPLTTRVGALRVWFWKGFDYIDSEDDVFETPTPQVYKLFLMAKFYRKRSQNDNSYLQISDRYFADFNIAVNMLYKTNRRDAGSPRSFKFLPQRHRGHRSY